MSIFCNICNEKTKYTKNNIFSKFHLNKYHNINAKEYYDKFIKTGNIGICLVCGEKTNFINLKKGYNICCSPECNYKNKIKFEKNKKTCLERYGVDHQTKTDSYKQKVKKTCLEKYGTEHSSQNDIVKQKGKNTCLEKYDHVCSLHNNDIRKKKEETFLRKYGTIHPIKNNGVKEKMVSTTMKSMFDKIKNIFLKNNQNISLHGYDKNKITIKCEKCNNIFSISSCLLNIRLRNDYFFCTYCHPINISNKESKLRIFIKENYKNNILFNDRKILDGGELDIYLPDLKLAFEFNGLYWHSELYRDKNYHINKTELSEKKGIKLIHIYEDDWLYKQDIVKSRILNLLGKSKKIYARQCEIREVSSKDSKEFLEENHIQGSVNSKYNYGLYYMGEIVSIISFSKGRFRNDCIELTRFCNKKYTSVVGGASKLFKHYLNKHGNGKIMSYADRSWSNGNLYKKLGFNFIMYTKPNYYYIIHGIRENRFKYRKSELIKMGFDANKTEHEIMLERKKYKIYDSGNLKYEFKS